MRKVATLIALFLTSPPAAGDPGRPMGTEARDVYRWVLLGSTMERGLQMGDIAFGLDTRIAIDPHWAFGFGIGTGILYGEEVNALQRMQTHAVLEVGPGRSLHGPYAALWLGALGHGPHDEDGGCELYKGPIPEFGILAGMRSIWHPGFVLDVSAGWMPIQLDHDAFPYMVRVGAGWAPLRPGNAPRPGYRKLPRGWNPEVRALVIGVPLVLIAGGLFLAATWDCCNYAYF